MRRWFAYEGLWKSKLNGQWIEDPPPVPDWANPLDYVRFVRIWVSSPDLNTVKRELFWMSHDEIALTVVEISNCLEEEGYHPLPERLLRERGLFTTEQLCHLEDLGFIERVELANSALEEGTTQEDSNASEEYDVVQAILNAPQKPYEPLSHIQTTEGGRFQAKH